MNLEDLKSAWQVYDKKIQASQAINEKLIESIIKERSVSRVAVIKRQYHFFFFMMAVELVVLAAILIGNPFDFKYRVQFVPYVLVGIGVVVAIFNLLKLYRKLCGPLSNSPIGVFLKNILESYEQNKVFEQWFGVIFLSVGLIIPLSFLPHKMEHNTLTAAILEISLMMLGTLLLYLIAFRLGAFKNRHKEKFSKDLAELNELKAMSLELKEQGAND